MNDLAFNKALQAIWELIGAANKYIDDTAPWALAKDAAKRQRLGTVMYNLLEAVRLIALLVAPFCRTPPARSSLSSAAIRRVRPWRTPTAGAVCQPGSAIAKAAPLFPRIEEE